jgi:hypothetical protein
MATSFSIFNNSYVNVTNSGTVSVFPFVDPSTYKLFSWGTSGDTAGYDSVDVSGGLSSIYSNGASFVGIKTDGTIITWGASYGGGAIPAGSLTQLSGQTVVSITGSNFVFAALTSAGRLVPWGHSSAWGNLSENFEGLDLSLSQYLGSGVDRCLPGINAAMGIRTDGKAYVWGPQANESANASTAIGANGVHVPGNTLHNDSNIVDGAFSPFSGFAVQENGNVLAWGRATHGGDFTTWSSPHTSTAGLKATIDGTSGNKVSKIYAGYQGAVLAIKTDGSAITWGNAGKGGDSSAVSAYLDGTIAVTEVFHTYYTFCALRADGSVICWGPSPWPGGSFVGSGMQGTTGGDSPVVSIVSNFAAFCARHADGTITTWGSGSGGDAASSTIGIDGTTHGGSGADLTASLVNITKVVGSRSAFCALSSDNGGTVYTWGDNLFGGEGTASYPAINNNVLDIASATNGFSAVKATDIISWGNATTEDNSAFSGLLSGTALIANNVSISSEYYASTGTFPDNGSFSALVYNSD